MVSSKVIWTGISGMICMLNARIKLMVGSR